MLRTRMAVYETTLSIRITGPQLYYLKTQCYMEQNMWLLCPQISQVYRFSHCDLHIIICNGPVSQTDIQD